MQIASGLRENKPAVRRRWQEDKERESHPRVDYQTKEEHNNRSVMKKADILDDWGPKFQEKVQALIYKHHHLFRSELGMFNNTNQGSTLPGGHYGQ